MFGNPSWERAALEATYEDTARIYRPVPVKGSDGITRVETRPHGEPFLCGLSRKSDRSYQGEAQTLKYDRELFCPPDTGVLPGDSMEVTRFGRATRFQVVGEPMVYATHLEVLLKMEDLA